MRRSFCTALLWTGIIGLIAVASPGGLFAQEVIEEYSESEPTADQVRLNKAAVDAIVAEDYARASKLLEASLELGENNVTWLNLGRAYQKLGRCKDAKKAYLSAVSAPAVEEPSPKLVNAKAEQYLEELEDGECEENTQLAEGDGEDEPEETAEEASDENEDDEVAVEPPPAETGGGSSVAGWASTITGGVLLGAGATFYLLARQEHQVVTDALDDSRRAENGSVTQISRSDALERQERGDLYDTIALSSTIAGAAATGLGVYLLLSDDTEPQVSLGTDGSNWSVSFSGRF